MVDNVADPPRSNATLERNRRDVNLVTGSMPVCDAARQHAAPPSDASRSADYRALTSAYREPALRRSLTQLATSIVPFCALWALMWLSLSYSYLLVLALAVPTAGFLVRLFILQHDCGHGSFFKSKAANDAMGRALSILTMTPYDRWRKNHAVHHATSGDLDRRGCGDVHMLTVGEYCKLRPLRKLLYRFHRHPFVLFGIGPFIYFVIFQRFTFHDRRLSRKERAGVHWTNVGLLAAAGLMGWLVGFGPFLSIHVPMLAIAASAGAWLFYVQHHFESTYFRRHDRWDYFDAGLAGSSYYQLPAPLRWITADIGLHHIHHLDSQIPNYRLQECFKENPALQRVARLTLSDSLSCASLKLWDEEKSEMVGLSKIT
jgi:omega-6 fatty acid desaturase (delta-12 desaturase)